MTNQRRGGDLETMLQGLANMSGVPLDQLAVTAARIAAGDGGEGPTLAAEFDDWTGRPSPLSKTSRRTYRRALVLAVDGWVYGHPYLGKDGSRDYKVYEPGKTAEWHAAAIEVADDYGMPVPPPLEQLPRRGPDGPLVVWQGLGDVPIDRLTTLDVEAAAKWAQFRAVVRSMVEGRGSHRSDGVGAHDTVVTALARLLDDASKAGLLTPGSNPAALADRRRNGKRKTRERPRRVSEPQEFRQVQLAWCDGSEAVRDTLLFNYFVATSSRAGGAILLKRRHVDPVQQLVYPPDKGSQAARGILVEDEAMPVPGPLCQDLLDYATSRGSTGPDDLVFLDRSGQPLTGKKLATIYRRVVSAVDALQQEPRWGSHNIRTTVAQQVEDLGTSSDKRRYLRHAMSDPSHHYGGTSLQRLARVMCELLGFDDHPVLR